MLRSSVASTATIKQLSSASASLLRRKSFMMAYLPPYRYISGDELATLMKSGAKPRQDYVVVDDAVQTLLEETKDIPKVVFHCALSQQRGPKAARIYSELRSEREERLGNDPDTPNFEVLVLRGGFTEFQLRHRNDKTLIEAWDKNVWNNPYF